MPRNVFSIEYKDLDHPYYMYSVDWWGKERGGWMPVSKSMTGSEWHPEKFFSKIAYEAILKKFQIEKLVKELPRGGREVILMSPAELMRFRKEKGLPVIDVFDDIGDEPRARAEEYE